MRFDELYLTDDILDAIDAMHFKECTPIQERTIPLITEGKDLIAVAQTGTGKTAAYLLPVIDEIANGDYPQDAINCIVMAPTRELAQQIDQQMQGFAYYMPVSSVAIYGGTDGHTFEQQKKGLKLGADVVIATPGRLIAHLSMGYVDLSKVSFLILDEADRMLDMGFYDDIMQIVKQLPKERQTLLFSATMPPKIKQLANSILRNPAEVKLAVSKPAEKIDQSAYICYETQKIPILRHVFKTIATDRSIVFASSKQKCKELCKTLRGLNLSVGEMHSDLDQTKREDMLLDFKSGKIKILVATDIMARGIDIDDIGLVVNYDCPHENEDYVHRIGRTARANTDGIAITFVSEREIGKFKRIEKFIEKEVRKNEIPPEIGEGPEYVEARGNGRKENQRKGKKKRNTDSKESKEAIRRQEDQDMTAVLPPETGPDADRTSDNQETRSKKKRRKKQRKVSSPDRDTQITAETEEVVSERSDDSEPSETVEAVVVEDTVSEQGTPAEDQLTEEKVAEEISQESQSDSDKDKKKKRRRKKKKASKSEDSAENTEADEELDLGPDPYGDRPISYSMVSAMMAAEARERKARELAERDARAAAKKAAADKTPAEPAIQEDGHAFLSDDQATTDENIETTVSPEPDSVPVSEPVVEVETGGDKPAATRKKATRRTRKKNAETAEETAPAEQTANEESLQDKPQPEAKPKRRGRKKTVKSTDDNSADAEQPEIAGKEVPEQLPETKPVKSGKRTAKKKTMVVKETADTPGDVTEETAVSEEKPQKRSRKRAETSSEKTVDTSEEKPKKKRTVRKKTAETVAEDSSISNDDISEQ